MGTSNDRTMAPKRKEPLKSMRWSFERFLTLVSVDKGASMGDDGAGDDGSEDEGTIVGR